MFSKKEQNFMAYNENERVLIDLPYCSCNTCVSIYEDLKTKIEKDRFSKLDSIRISKFFNK